MDVIIVITTNGNFFSIYQDGVDSWRLFDNADMAKRRLLAYRDVQQPPSVVDPDAWTALREQA